jgi:polar amino acid transport system substrate-binding protein
MIKRVVLIFAIFISFLYSEQKELKKVSLQLHWLHQFEFAGYYMAKEKGFYKEAGFDVEIKEYKYGMNVLDEVMSNRATYAIGGSDLIIEVSKGVRVKLLASIFQSSPLVLLTTNKSGIKSIKDFKGKRIMITPDAVSSVTFNAMMRKDNLSTDDLITQKHSFDVHDLIAGRTDLFQSYLSNEPFTLIKNGVTPIIFDPKDYGFDLYSDILFTSMKEYEKDSSSVVAFREASLRGWRYALDNIEESVSILLKKYNTQKRTKDALLYEARVSKKLAYKDNIPLGNINESKIQRVYDAYNIMNFIDNQEDIRKYILYTEDSTENLNLSSKERAYLRKKGSIKMCIEPNWLPFSNISKDGSYEGIMADMFALIQKSLPIEFEIIKTQNWSDSLQALESRECDILSGAINTPSRSKSMDFTTPYIDFPLVIATKERDRFINDIQEVRDKPLSVIKNHAYIEVLKRLYPDINIVEVDSVSDGLKLVEKNIVYGYIDALAPIAYYIRKDNIVDVRISGKFDSKWGISIATRNDETMLNSILQKSIERISQEEINSIVSKWIDIKVNPQKDYSSLYKAIVVFAFILAFAYWRYIEIKKINKRLKETTQKLEEASSAKSIFLANMSHEIRTPISGSLGLIEIVLKSDLDKNQREYLAKTHNSMSILLSLINDVMDYSKVTSKDIVLNSEVFDIAKIVSDVVNLFVVKADEKSLSLHYNIDKDVPKLLIGDSLKLIQVINNLVGNGIKFTNSGEVFIDVRLKDITNDNAKVEFVVQDSGIGIADIDQDRVFNAFEQVNSIDTKKTQGVGLGLMIAQKIVQAMGGKIVVDSQKAHGSRFSFDVAFGYIDATKYCDISNHMTKSIKVDAKKALLAEDDEINLIAHCYKLKELGFDIDIARDGQEAIDMAMTYEYDMIFLDLQMPIVDGYTTAKRIKSEGISTPIVAISAFGDSVSINLAKQSGVDEYIIKPIDNINSIITKYFDISLIEQDTNIDTKIVDIRGVDTKELSNYLNDSVAILMLESFYSQFGEFESNIGDISSTSFDKQIHSLKGASGNLKMRKIYTLTSQIESSSDKNIIKPLLDELLENLADTIYDIKEYILPIIQKDTTTSKPLLAKDTLISNIDTLIVDIDEHNYIDLERINRVCKDIYQYSDEETAKEIKSLFITNNINKLKEKLHNIINNLEK